MERREVHIFADVSKNAYDAMRMTYLSISKRYRTIRRVGRYYILYIIYVIICYYNIYYYMLLYI